VWYGDRQDTPGDYGDLLGRSKFCLALPGTWSLCLCLIVVIYPPLMMCVEFMGLMSCMTCRPRTEKQDVLSVAVPPAATLSRSKIYAVESGVCHLYFWSKVLFRYVM
jgi:hypothetical protein